MLSLQFFNIEPPHEYIPTTTKEAKVKYRKRSNSIDLIIPVYEGYIQTKRCIESVLKSNIQQLSRIIVINDCSPNQKINSYLKKLAQNKKIELYENESNKGFVRSVNFAMSLSQENDVVLLNSDTEVNGNWLKKLIWHAYSKPKVASVTPFSNNATICSYPNLLGFNEFPENETTETLDNVLYNANRHCHIEIPTAVGFCMYIRRECLNEIGFFDEETFGKGYGEENEFCLRASTRKKWVHLLAADTFVFHEGAVSFSAESNNRKKRALASLLNLYPDYENLIHSHIKKNEVFPLITSATISRCGSNKKIKVLHILHNLGGGTEKYVKDLSQKSLIDSIHLVMRPYFDESGKKYLQIFSIGLFEKFNIKIEYNNLDTLVKILVRLKISFVHIHHLLNHSIKNIEHIITRLNIPYYVSIHDYMFICPQVILISQTNGKYCDLPNKNQCDVCISKNQPFGCTNITSWLKSHKKLINNAQKIICPSVDVAQRIAKKYAKAKIIVTYHEEELDPIFTNFKTRNIKKNEVLKIALLGILAPHKGFSLIKETLSVISRNKIPIEFKLIGRLEDGLELKETANFLITGEYQDQNLASLIDVYNPHLILFASQCPETYSYTLTRAKESGYPIAAPNIGAFKERLNKRPWTWIYEWDSNYHKLLGLFENIRVNLANKIEPPLIETIDTKIKVTKNFYKTEYFKIARVKAI